MNIIAIPNGLVRFNSSFWEATANPVIEGLVNTKLTTSSAEITLPMNKEVFILNKRIKEYIIFLFFIYKNQN